MDHALIMHSNQVVAQSSKKRARTTSRSEAPKQKHEMDEEKKENEMKKSMHREIERQRRQEMSNLYASLRELLPLEFIKGKRSVSDHMHEATNYIKHMEKNIQDLKLKRDKLMKTQSNLSSSEIGVNFLNSVTVNYCCDGIEVLINCGSKEGHGFALSRVFLELMQTGLDIITCISNKVNDRLLYKIHTEVNPLVYIDICELQKSLVNVINQDSSNLLGVDFDICR